MPLSKTLGNEAWQFLLKYSSYFKDNTLPNDPDLTKSVNLL